jgi:hypothetical protein
MGTNADLYEQDFFEWTQTTAALLRQGKWHEIDSESVAEELASLGKRDRRELGSRLEVLIMHLLKWCYQPEQREHSHSWSDTIWDQRRELTLLLDDSSSLRRHGPLLLQQRYPHARQKALNETRLPEQALPQECPWTVEQILDNGFWPERAS